MRRLMLVMGAIAMALCVNNAWGADDDIEFAPKNFADLGDMTVGISGTLTGDSIGLKNNTYVITCMKDHHECFITSIGQIGDHQIGRLDYVYSIPITKWNAYEVVATEDATPWSCSKTTITLVRKSETALWVREPINQTSPQCKNADTKIRKWTIEDSLVGKRMHNK
jgi:hypothetical protein